MASALDKITIGDLEIAVIDSDPTTGGGYASPLGGLSIINGTGAFYKKTGVLATDWSLIADASQPIDAEKVQDALAAALTNSGRISFTYNDPGNTISADVIAGSLDNSHIATGAAIALAKLAALANSRAVVSDGSGVISTSATTATEIGFVSGVTSSIQTQINGKANTSHTHTSADVTDFTEAAQDAVGGALVDSASVDFTYNDAGNSITAAVLPAGVDHNSLANVATGDAHTQYALLAGRAGGQTVNGGTAASNNLTLNSTSNATKGKILLGANNAIDEANNRLGIGTNAPATSFEINKNSVQFNNEVANVSTTNATATTLFTLSTSTNSVEFMKVYITGINTTTQNSVAYERSVRIKNSGGTVTLGTLQSDYTNEDGAMSAANVQVVVSGTDILVQVIGIASNNITWKGFLNRLR